MANIEATELLTKYIEAQCSLEEMALVESWCNHVAIENAEYELDYEAILAGRERVWKRINSEKKAKSRSIYKVAAVAACLMMVIGSVYYFSSLGDHKKNQPVFATATGDIKPGGSKAILTLDGGREIDLDPTSNGIIATQPGASISITEEGLAYKFNAKTARTGVTCTNKLTVPLGGNYQVILPDGSKVYLNAGSSLIYPTRFPKDKRNVELTGEGYFVIAKDAAKPFIVACPGQIVRVTGTRFNISSYSNEQVRTTLLQGKVAIKESSKEEYQPLNPGQQATLAPQGLEISNVNAIDAIGWTNNIFIFSQTPIKDVLMQISRWYNVDVDYTGLPENIRLVGECGKDLMLSEVLNSIHAMSKINFVLEGNKIKIR